MLDHEGLDVYQLSLDFLVIANTVIEGFPRGRSHLADQFTRASLSIVLNIAEGAGKHSKPDKRRYYLIARGSATESAALLDVCHRYRLDADQTRAKLRGALTARCATKAKRIRWQLPPCSCGVFSRNGWRSAETA